MAELTIQIGDSPNPLGFKDGDIIHAHNDIFMLWQHTQKITNHRKIGGGFFKPLGCMACKQFEVVSKWKFERVSKTAIKRTLLSDMSEEILSGTPNAKGNAIDVPQYIARRKAAGKRAMFGEEGSVIWFEGHREITLPMLSTLWTETITPEIGLLEADHRRQNYPTHFLKKYLVLITNDFDNVRRGVLESPDIDEKDPDNPVTLVARKHKVNWQNLEGLSAKTISNIEDKTLSVKVKRDLVRVEADITEAKTR